jgi:DNA-directed RNA polymerase specialized sigma24 family protein
VRHSAPNPPPTEPEGLPEVETFRELYDKTIHPIAGWLFGLGTPEGEQKDAIQEIYLEASRCWTKFSPTFGTRKQWLYGIAVNVVRRIRRRARSRARWEEPGSDDRDVASTSPTAEDHVIMNDRARFTAQLFEPISTLPLVIMIAHDVNGEPMKEIAARHQLSLSEAYRLRDHAKHLFTEGYEREQETRRKAGVLVLPVRALSLLGGPLALPELSPQLKADMWARITQGIRDGSGPAAPAPDSPAQAASLAASIPPMPLPSAAPLATGSAVPALRAALSAHPIAGPALIFLGGILAGLVGEHLFVTLDKNKHPTIVQEAPAALGAGAPVASVASVPADRERLVTTPRASASAHARRAPVQAGQLTPAEAARFDIVRAAFATPETDRVLEAIDDYLNAYPRGHFVNDCEKMRSQTLSRAARP